MNKRITFLCLISFMFIAGNNTKAQKIGINTASPKTGTILHIDAQKNTSAAGDINCEDDVVIDSEGKMGIGKCTVSTDTKLEINGKFRLSEGASNEKILMSDQNGNASWQSFALGDFDTTFHVDMNMASIPFGAIYTISGIASLPQNQLELTTDGVSKVTVPAGRYLLSLANNIDVINEYCNVYIYINGQGVFDKTYDIFQGGASFYMDFAQNSEIEIKFEPLNIGSGLPYIAPLPYTNPNGGALHVWADLNIVRIQGNH
ncbi:hypothetical protein JI747_011430 [Chryseobacterium sp. RG1]|uniref:Uncharacterized protein n=1 Tax=Chryseobacterium tagetis TaxID=2801334 RepID=A0ABS8A380_9FLAO|nr:hypothetical protein [Chryseobacterium tagetis]MCA6067793.1 hypothetical protein [Chryseobacterium tagetis]